MLFIASSGTICVMNDEISPDIAALLADTDSLPNTDFPSLDDKELDLITFLLTLFAFLLVQHYY